MIITQVWYGLYNFNHTPHIINIIRFRSPKLICLRNWISEEWIDLLRKHGVPFDDEKVKSLPRNTDYWAFSNLLNKKSLSLIHQNLTRRWDLFHTFSSTGLTAGISLIIGYIVRWLLFPNYMPKGFPTWSFWENLHIIIIIMTFFIIILCWKSALRIHQEYSRLLTLLIKDYFIVYGSEWRRHWWYNQ